MGLATHLKLRAALLFVGFFAGGILHMQLPRTGVNAAFEPILFFLLPFGGAFGLQFAFARLYPAACPRCGAAAWPQPKNPTLYLCRGCATESNGLEGLMREAAPPKEDAPAPGEVPARPRLSSTARMMWLFLAMGLLSLGVGGFKATDSIRLVREGVSADARVVKVTTRSGTDREGNAETIYTALVQYQAGPATRTLERSWGVRAGGSCGWPCYSQGEALKVIYLPADPATVKIYSIGELAFGAALFGLVGLIFVVVAIVMLYRTGR